MHARQAGPAAVSNSHFLRELAQPMPSGCALWVAAFIGSPDSDRRVVWAGRPYSPGAPGDIDQTDRYNTYFSVAALRPDGSGELRRRKANFERLLALVCDDVEASDLVASPTYVLATSPGKRQVGVFLDEADPDCADTALVDRLMSVLAAKGLVRLDAHGNNVVRYVRLPCGTNHKERPSGPFSHQLEQWSPGVRLTLEDAAAVFGVDLEDCRKAPAAVAAAPASADQADKISAAMAAVLAGQGLHDNLRDLAASLVASGTAPGAVVNTLRALMEHSAAPRDERFKARYDDIPRTVTTAQEKFAKPVEIRLFAQEEPAALAPAPDVPARLLSIPGRLGEAVTWISATARKPQPLLAVQAALALGSAVTGRRYRTTNGNWTMLYLLNVAASGGGKEHAKHAIEELLEAAGLGRLIGAGRFASESGVLSALIERPALFSVIDEFGKKLQSASVAQNFADRNTLTFLTEVWGRADGVARPVAYSTAGLSSKQAEELGRRMVRKPSLTLLALTAPDPFFAGVTSAAIADGFLARYLIVHADRGRQLARIVEPIAPPAALVDWMKSAHAGPDRAGNLAGMPVPHDAEPTPIVFDFDAGARARFLELGREMNALGNELDAEGLGEMADRVTEIAMRVALIVAVSLEDDIVTGTAAAWACEYVKFHFMRSIAMLQDRLSDGPFDQLCKEIVRLVRDAGARGATERELNKSSRSFRASTERMRLDALASLQRREEITRAEIATPGGRGRKRIAFVSSALIKTADNADKSPTDV